MENTFNIREYIKNNHKAGKFGIKYLDDNLKGILKGDLILIGARSGSGKSTLSQNIAMANTDKKVKLFSLENFKNDDLATETYKQYKNITREYTLHIRDFVSGDFKPNEDALTKAEGIAKSKFNHIKIVSRQKDYFINKLKEDIICAVAKENCELIIIDHLDYLDKDNPNENDNSHMTELMKTIREVQDDFKCAVVAISHLRKSNSAKDAPVVPSMDEFHGSSNKVKEATVVIMFAPDDITNQSNAGGNSRATWCCIRKLRMGGVDNTVARLYFDIHKNNYANSFEICSVNYSGNKVEPIKVEVNDE